MKLKWMRYKHTYVLVRLGVADIKPCWLPEAWVALRKIYEDKPAAWFAYRLDVPDDETPFVGEFSDLWSAKSAAESAITSHA